MFTLTLKGQTECYSVLKKPHVYLIQCCKTVKHKTSKGGEYVFLWVLYFPPLVYRCFFYPCSLRHNNHPHTQRDIHIVWSVIFCAVLLWYNSGLDTITISKSNGASTAFTSFRWLSTLSLLLACSVQHHKTPRWSNPYGEVITRCYSVRPQHGNCFILTCCGLRTLAWLCTRLTGVVTDHRRQTARLSLAS